MSYYSIAYYDIHDLEMYAQYVQAMTALFDKKTQPIIIDYEANYLEGDGRQAFIVLKFESEADMQTFINSKSYQAIVPLRHQSTTGWVRVAPHFVPPSW